MKKEILKRIGIVAVIFAIVIYVVVIAVNANLNNSNELTTEIAVKYKYNESIAADALIVREETVIYNNISSGVEYYIVEDGDKVAVGTSVAKVFSDETDALFYNKVQEIDKKIEILESLNKSYDNVSNDGAVDAQIYLNIKDLLKAVNNNDYSDRENSSQSLVYSINQRQRIVGTVSDFNTQIQTLKQEKAKYSDAGSSYVHDIKAPNAGYFVANVDGYENVYDYDTVTELTVDDLNRAYMPENVTNNAVGKIVSGLDWYIVCKLTSDEALSLSHSESYPKIVFSSASDEPVPVELVALNQSSKQSDAVAIFKCNYMNNSLSHMRNETVQILINDFEGVRLSKSALHDDYVEILDEEGEPTGETARVQGVYILHGSELLFREVSVIFAGKDFVIVDINPESAILKSDRTIIINDEVVIEGENLYDGKIIK
ncbi:MAG: hypothetical protein E7532_05425 [Ruminococcaceae bacterium]|nr:hypothetical protein [Oscillospiraceae bacterium]